MKKNLLFAARIAELTYIVLTRKIGVAKTVQEESIPSPSSPANKGKVNMEKHAKLAEKKARSRITRQVLF